MPFHETGIPGLLIYEPAIHGDHRGYFFESYNAQTFQGQGINIQFVQDNQARSSYGVLRGLHYQLNPHAQTKLIRVLEGEIIDAVVDIRKGSPTYGKSFAINLSANNKRQLLVPQGFAHGYAVLSPTAEVMYKCDNFYHKASEGGIIYNDPTLQINWGIDLKDAIVSDKDQVLPKLADLEHNFVYQG
ncbi:dTDP-4-dehydrorhamnose 3,5-epimerase [Chitinophaga costaii]|uniref:dTDP-4-dehydrorhamnose 3,5-epimerase n=1 Tax=Chitinophaga costaii TaxID=1335309 RepID=A0A1C4A044_9BACT|nr:dTDP-4-dehydrorhamnose 3,5-epimerase [Chitinophaga costaii]PUZ30578.1 dTDP-4-dehydrorhamnose 3,5-epimerase [Chitinophaga costaii]SCB87915.1 dTDP-4-dehydrorhamnose 3,5-epimerase [Chitinophaga costaii]